MRHHMKKRRLELGLSQQAIANKAGMSRANYAHIERGRHEPSLEQMELLAKALGVKPDINFFKNYCDIMEQNDFKSINPTGTTG